MLDFLLKNPGRDQEFTRLESQLPETEMNHLIKFTADNVMESVKMLTFVFICLTILNGISPEICSRDVKVLAISCCVAIVFIISGYFISKFPEYLQGAIFGFNAFGYVAMHLIYQTNHFGHLRSAMPCLYLFHYFLATLTPSKRQLTSLIFTVTVIMNFSLSMYRLGKIDNDITISGLMSILFFDLGLKSNQSKLSEIYLMILKNDKLAKEKQKVVQQFPHPVLILPQKISKFSKCYPNDQFEKKIKALNQRIEKLDQVKVTVTKKAARDKDVRKKLTLLEYIQCFQKNKKRGNDEAKRDAVIQCDQTLARNSSRNRQAASEESDSEGMLKRNFSIKSLNIEWKGFPSVMHVFIDTTDIIKLEQAKNRIKMQDIMFASASHEFRTPLNAIIHSYNFIKESFQELVKILDSNMNENLAQNSDIQFHKENISKFLRTGSTSSVLLLSLVQDILNLTRIENGNITTKFDYFRVPELLSDVHSLFSVQCENKRVDLIIECEDALKLCEVSTDSNRIKQILVNLVSNSVKFTFRGSIIMKAALKKTLEGDDIVEFRVCDTGTGIKEEDQECLFKLFGVIGENEDLNPNGCGLGLTISKKYVESLGGKIRVESVYGEGTEMIFTIRLIDIKQIQCNRRVPASPNHLPVQEHDWEMRDIDFQVNEEHSSMTSRINDCKFFGGNESKF
ncbi:unnamed protein product [Moneuplotes crassus]|uniref:histidine kinase n=1 Tax=Euplotes crassus TaxID=5936 RepID=A0AAD1Y1E7_EUPCR|nr:unnamed protein product [Moneuplotes crassus]